MGATRLPAKIPACVIFVDFNFRTQSQQYLALTYRIQSRDFAKRSAKIIWRAFPPLHTELDTPFLGSTASPLKTNSDTL
jgi:hypothetical protein